MTNSQKCAEYSIGSEFQSRINNLLTKAAIAVMAEDVGTVHHAERIIYARKVLDGSANIARYAMAVSTNSTVAALIVADQAVSDSDLEFTVNSMFTAFSL